ncbi:MAG: proteasome subunit alpha [Nitrososphaerota archaeon]
MLPQTAGYDRTVTLFGPDGRLYQVEYAMETVRRGSIALAIKCRDGVVLAAEEKLRPLQSATFSQKIFQIDTHIAATASGYIPDARLHIDNARWVAQTNRLLYDEPVEISTVTKSIADLCQQFTQYGGVRPFGVAIIIAGVDSNGPAVYQVEPSGTYASYDAVSIGGGSDQVMEFLEKNYRPDMTLEQAKVLAVQCIYLVSEDKVGIKHIRLAYISSKDRAFKMAEEEEVKRVAEEAKKALSSPKG